MKPRDKKRHAAAGQRRAPVQHAPVIAARVNDTARYHYRNWSYMHRCPTCGREARFNSNFLGQRRVVCDGVKFRRVPKSEAP